MSIGENEGMKRTPGAPFAALGRSARAGFLVTAMAGATWSGSVWGQGKSTDFYEDALRRFESKDYAGAVIQLKNTLNTEPSKLAAHLLLGKALLQTGDVAAAEVALTEAIGLGVNRSEAALALAESLMAQGKPLAVLNHAALEPAGLPASVQRPLLLLQAAAHTDLGDNKAALARVQQARQLDARQPDTWLAEVPIRVRARQFAEATEAAQKALALQPGNAEALYVKGSVAHVQGNLSGALADYDRALQIAPQHTESLVARIGLHLDHNRLPEARLDLASLQKAAPGEPRAAYLRALLAERAGDTPAAQAALREVTGLLDPIPIAFVRYRPQLLMLNGLAHFGLNQPEKAKQYLELFLKVQGNSPVTRLLARIYLNEGNTALAMKVLEDYVKRQPEDGQALNLLGSAYMSQGRSAKATELLQQALKTQDDPAFRTTLGLSLLGAGQTSGAVAELEAAYRKDPRHLTAGVALTQLYLHTQRLPQAVALAQKMVKQQPTHSGLHYLLGNALARSGQAPAARAAFERAVALAPQLAPAQLQLARMDIDARALQAAEQRLNTLLKAQPKNADAMAEMARVAHQRGQHAQALRWLVKARDSAPHHALRWDLALIDWHLRSGNPSQALEAAKIAATKNPNDISLLLLSSQVQLALGDHKSAQNLLTTATRIAAYDAPLQTHIAERMLAARHLPGAAYSLEKALSGQPHFVPAQVLQARVELLQGDATRAEQRARRVVQDHPDSAAGHDVLGDIAAAQGRHAAAITAYRQAQRVAPGTATALKLMEALNQQGQATAAVDVGTQHLRRQPDDATVHKALANLHARAGRFADAASGYTAALKHQPNDAEALNNLANAQLRLQQPAALQTAEQAMALAPDHALVIDTLGWVLLQQGQTARALQLLRDARLREPGNPEIRYHLAQALARSGRPAEARQELVEALNISRQFEGFQDAERLLASLP